jgi:hypothetical protein
MKWKVEIEFPNMPEDSDLATMKIFLMALLESDDVEYNITRLERLPE